MSDINASERRLSAALDRIDQLLEAGAPRQGSTAAAADLSEYQDRITALEAENTRLSTELAALQADRGGPLEAALAEARSRLAAAGEQAARLSTANEELASANRGLIEAASGEGDATDASIVALEAEVSALRAARAAEIAQMGDIMQELERLMAQDPHLAGAPEAAVQAEATGDAAGVPETQSEQDGDR